MTSPNRDRSMGGLVVQPSREHRLPQKQSGDE
jgi:hypothetical protein